MATLVSTICGNGWVDHSSCVGRALGPPATAGGTDLTADCPVLPTSALTDFD